MSDTIRELDGAVVIKLRIQPRASRNEIAGLTGDLLRIRLTAPPVEGAANQALIEFLADALSISRGAISLRSGQTGRNKSVVIRGISAAQVAAGLGLERLPR